MNSRPGTSVDGQYKLLPVDNVVICTGQQPQRELHEQLVRSGLVVHLIGGADVAAELDAKRAIDQGARLAAMRRIDHADGAEPAGPDIVRRYHSWKCCMPSSMGLW